MLEIVGSYSVLGAPERRKSFQVSVSPLTSCFTFWKQMLVHCWQQEREWQGWGEQHCSLWQQGQAQQPSGLPWESLHCLRSQHDDGHATQFPNLVSRTQVRNPPGIQSENNRWPQEDIASSELKQKWRCWDIWGGGFQAMRRVSKRSSKCIVIVVHSGTVTIYLSLVSTDFNWILHLMQICTLFVLVL